MTSREPREEYFVDRQLDRLLPEAMRPTPSGARLDLRILFGEDEKGERVFIHIVGPDGKVMGPPLPLAKPGDVGPYFGRLAAKAFKVAAAKRTRPLGWRRR